MNYKKLLFCFLSPMVLLSCKDDSENVAPVNPGIATSNVTEVTTDEATLNGEIQEIGNQKYTDFGFVWDTIPNVSISSRGKITLSSIPIQGKISRKISGLIPGKTYYAKMFISNKETSLMGEQVTFETKPQFVKSISSTVSFFGKELKIRGKGFSSRISDNQVEFVQESYNFKATASVIAATDSVITIIVPGYPYVSPTDPYETKINVTVKQTQLKVSQKFSYANYFTLEQASSNDGQIVVVTIDHFSSYSYKYYINDVEVPITWTWNISNGTQVGLKVPQGLAPGIITVKVEANSKRPILAKDSNQINIKLQL